MSSGRQRRRCDHDRVVDALRREVHGVVDALVQQPAAAAAQGKLLKSLPSVVAAPFGITTVDCAVAETAP
jgi:hypothetical protein